MISKSLQWNWDNGLIYSFQIATTYILTYITLETFNSLYSFPIQLMILFVIMTQPAVVVFFTAGGLQQQNHTINIKDELPHR